MSTGCLKKDSILKDRYRIIKKLGQGGFGVTYLAIDSEIEQYVVLKECFPLNLTERDDTLGYIKLIYKENAPLFEKELKKFLDEARRMAKLQHISEIAKVLGYFKENNTAYIVMEYVKGTNFRTFIENMDEPFTFEKGRDFLLPIIRALNEVHKKGLIHRDLTPENILIKEDRSIKVIDFGASREFVDDKTKTILVKSGYAPLEQYSKKEKQGPWTDVYGICAVFYEMLTGAAPQDSLSRMESDELYPPSMYGAEITVEQENVLMKGLSQNYQQRYQSMKQLEQAFLLSEKIITEKSNEESLPEKGNSDKCAFKKKSLKRYILTSVCGTLVLSGILGCFLCWKWKDKDTNSNLETVASYAGNYKRNSEKHLKFQEFVKEKAVFSEADENEEYLILNEESVLEWGEPCNQMHFSKKIDDWLDDISEYEWDLYLKEEGSENLFEVLIKKYGAIETNFLEQNIYTWNEMIDVYVSYDPVNEEILEISVMENDENKLDKEDEIILITADVLITLSEYEEIKKEKLIKSIEQGTVQKSEKMGNMYIAESFGDVHLIYGWDEEKGVFYKCKPYENMFFSMRHEYYWP